MYPSPARFLNLLYPLLVLWKGSEATTSASSSSLECSLPGLCRDFLLGENIRASLDNCILFGRSTPGATWVTFNRDLGACSAFQACDHLDASLPDRVSSDVNCTLCSVTGACQGVLLIDYYTNNAEDCLDLCLTEKDCVWYSFDAESLVCALFQSCSDLLVDGQEAWVSGEVACSSATTPTPFPPTPSTTPTTPAQTTTPTPAPAEDQEIVRINYADAAVRLGKFSTQILNVTRSIFELCY